MVSLANHVAAYLAANEPNSWVGMYAYASHWMPPTIAVEPNIHVQVAMGFNDTGLTYEELIEPWGEKSGSLGIREYFTVMAWDWGLPGRGHGSNPSYFQTWIPPWKAQDAVAINGQASANWGQHALPTYVLTRMLWDPQVDVEAVIDDFLTSAYGNAAETMRSLYEYFYTSPALAPRSIAEMIGIALTALDTPGLTAEEQTRIVDILAYLLYVDEYRRFRLAENTANKWNALDLTGIRAFSRWKRLLT